MSDLYNIAQYNKEEFLFRLKKIKEVQVMESMTYLVPEITK